MKFSRTVLFFIILIFILPVLAYATINWYQNRYDRLPVYHTPAKENLLNNLVAFSFANQDGRTLKSNDWNNKILVVNFFFTRCLSICPKMTKSLNGLANYFKNDSTVQLASFTVDPASDSSVQLKKYSRQFQLNVKHWNLLTGDKKDIYKIARNGFNIVAADGDGGPDDFIHSDQVVLIDNKKNIRGYYDGTKPDDIKNLITDIKKLEHEN